MNRRIAWVGLFATGVLVACSISAQTPAIPPRDAEAPVWTSPERMHEDYVQAFVHSEGFGKMRVTPMMRLMQSGSLVLEGDRLRVEDVQLIGIAKHDPPIVHAGTFMGFQYTDSKTDVPRSEGGRDLTASELLAVRAFAEGHPLVVNPQAGGLRVIGPIRATASCLTCHRRKKTGDLLGALIYQLGPVKLPE